MATNMRAHEAGTLHADGYGAAPHWLPYPNDVMELLPQLWSSGVTRGDDGVLAVAGVPVTDLAAQFGTAAYVVDEADFRSRARAFADDFTRPFVAVCGGADVYYAAKAFLCTAVARWIMEEGLCLDVCSGGELAVARRVGFPPERIGLHGVSYAVGYTAWLDLAPEGVSKGSALELVRRRLRGRDQRRRSIRDRQRVAAANDVANTRIGRRLGQLRRARIDADDGIEMPGQSLRQLPAAAPHIDGQRPVGRQRRQSGGKPCRVGRPESRVSRRARLEMGAGVGQASSTRQLSMTVLARSTSAIFSTCSRVTSSDTSISKRFPWRTSATPLTPIRPSARRTAWPWGSRISAFGMTFTTTRAMGSPSL